MTSPTATFTAMARGKRGTIRTRLVRGFGALVLLLVVAGVLALIGKKAVSKVGPPERTLRTSKDTVAFLKSPTSS